MASDDFSSLFDDRYTFSRYEEYVRYLVQRSKQQLEDSYDVQKMYDGTAGSSVWVRNKRHRDPVSRKMITIHNWHEESQYRKRTDSYNEGKNWYSTGHSRDVFDIKILSDDLRRGIIEVDTTFGALMAEKGVGKTGPKHIRAKKSSRGLKRIKVQRDADYVPKQRYAGEWAPMAGSTHRPTTRRQTMFMAKRIRNFAADVYGWNISTWIVLDIARAIDGTNTGMNIDQNGNVRLEATIGDKKVKDIKNPQRL